MRSLNLLQSEFDIAARDITVSTCGVVPGILALSALRCEVRHAVSLHATSNLQRIKLIPLNCVYDLNMLEAAITRYHSENNHPVLLQYTLLNGINDSDMDAERLAAFAQRSGCDVHLIPFNISALVNLDQSSNARLLHFFDTVSAEGVSCKIRKNRGIDIDGGCGQLYYIN